jgi:Holliday junction resolvasome RuvABC endonuclease subunit
MKPATVIGIDPAAKTGFFAYKHTDRSIQMTELLEAPKKFTYDRKIKWISDAVADCFAEFKPEEIALVSIETFVMKGKSGQVLQNLIGGIIARVPYEVELVHVSNTTVKRIVGGSCDDDKEAVAWGVKKYFADYSAESEGTIRGLIGKQQWDLTDAGAIAITGWEGQRK